jgi:hypothetical protein
MYRNSSVVNSVDSCAGDLEDAKLGVSGRRRSGSTAHRVVMDATTATHTTAGSSSGHDTSSAWPASSAVKGKSRANNA